MGEAIKDSKMRGEENGNRIPESQSKLGMSTRTDIEVTLCSL